MTPHTELWGLCKHCDRWFYVTAPVTTDTYSRPSCPVCAGPASVVIEQPERVEQMPAS